MSEDFDRHRDWLAMFLNRAPHIDPYDHEAWLVDTLLPYAVFLRAAFERCDHRPDGEALRAEVLAKAGREPARPSTIVQRLFYALDVPAARAAVLEGGEPRYACCHYTEAQGHAPSCTEETRVRFVEATLRRAGIGFVRVTEETLEART